LRLALDVPDDHAIDPRRLTTCLAAAIRSAGGEVREGTTVGGLEHTAGRVRGVTLTDGSSVPAQAVVIAAGAWASELITPSEIPSRPVKGQIMRLHDPSGPGLLRRVVRMGPTYIVPRGDGRYVIGATSEERGFDTTVTAGAALELLRDAGELVPGVSELVLDEFSAGLRPGTPDNLPVIGADAVAGLHWAVGHGRGGILLAPVTAELVCAELCGDSADPEAIAFTPGRFTSSPAGSPA
jgi:glycine oxidase